MLNIKYEITGQDMTSAANNTIMEALAGKAIESVKAKLTDEELSQITITVKGDSMDDLHLSVAGPEEIRAKLNAAL